MVEEGEEVMEEVVEGLSMEEEVVVMEEEVVVEEEAMEEEEAERARPEVDVTQGRKA